MAERLEIRDFLEEAKAGRIALDVRTPSEYRQGRIPGALNLPLFSDDERAEIGILYKQTSREAALMRGLEIVGPRMPELVRSAQLMAPGRDVLVHCWRGGQRSESVGWLLEMAGFRVAVLEGGYKAYRRCVLDFFEAVPHTFLVLGGPTGSGKTALLEAMRQQGAQTIDLEKLAHHKGSSFGGLGEEDQPSSEQFENELAYHISQLDPSRPVWIEHESRGIGKVFIPDSMWSYLQQNPLILADPGRESRLKRALAMYGNFEAPLLKACFARIQNRMGGQHVKAALEAIDAGDLETAASIALDYYDKTYSHHLEKYPHEKIRRIDIAGMPLEKAAQVLIELA